MAVSKAIPITGHKLPELDNEELEVGSIPETALGANDIQIVKIEGPDIGQIPVELSKPMLQDTLDGLTPEMKEKLFSQSRVVATIDQEPMLSRTDEIMADAINQMAEMENEEIARRIRYHGDIKRLVLNNGHLILLVTSIAEELGIELTVDESPHPVRKTNDPKAYSLTQLDNMQAYAFVAVRHLKEEASQAQSQIRQHALQQEMITKKLGDTIASLKTLSETKDQQVSEITKELRSRIEKLKRELGNVETVGKFVLHHDGKFVGQTDEGVPGLVELSRAKTFDASDDAHNYRSRIIKAIRTDNATLKQILQIEKSLKGKTTAAMKAAKSDIADLEDQLSGIELGEDSLEIARELRIHEIASVLVEEDDNE